MLADGSGARHEPSPSRVREGMIRPTRNWARAGRGERTETESESCNCGVEDKVKGLRCGLDLATADGDSAENIA